jgi:hypothetical protein
MWTDTGFVRRAQTPDYGVIRVTLAIGTSALAQMLSARTRCSHAVSEKLGRSVVELQESGQGEVQLQAQGRTGQDGEAPGSNPGPPTKVLLFELANKKRPANGADLGR